MLFVYIRCKYTSILELYFHIVKEIIFHLLFVGTSNRSYWPFATHEQCQLTRESCSSPSFTFLLIPGWLTKVSCTLTLSTVIRYNWAHLNIFSRLEKLKLGTNYGVFQEFLSSSSINTRSCMKMNDNGHPHYVQLKCTMSSEARYCRRVTCVFRPRYSHVNVIVCLTY